MTMAMYTVKSKKNTVTVAYDFGVTHPDTGDTHPM